jgi:hypothetical protein
MQDVRLNLMKGIFNEMMSNGSPEPLFRHLTEDIIYRITAPGRSKVRRLIKRMEAQLERAAEQDRARRGIVQLAAVLGVLAIHAVRSALSLAVRRMEEEARACGRPGGPDAPQPRAGMRGEARKALETLLARFMTFTRLDRPE